MCSFDRMLLGLQRQDLVKHLPILQRLLEEREKDAKMVEEKGEEPEKHAPTGLLRALIIAPTRELALQVFVKAFSSFSYCQLLGCWDDVYIYLFHVTMVTSGNFGAVCLIL